MNDEPLDPEEHHSELLASGASGGHMFRGIKLEPFSWGRMTALQRLTKEELSDMEVNGAIVYLCTLPAEKVEEIRGPVARRAFLSDLGRWVQAQGVLATGDSARSLADTADRIWAEYNSARSEPDTKGGGAGAGESSQAA